MGSNVVWIDLGPDVEVTQDCAKMLQQLPNPDVARTG